MYTMIRIDREDGSFHYEIMFHSSDPAEYRCIATVEEDIVRSGQALTDARLIVQALTAFAKEQKQ